MRTLKYILMTLVLVLFSTSLASAATLLGSYSFEETGWNGTAGELKDASGNGAHGSLIGSPSSLTSKNTDPARPGSTGTCNYAELPGPYSNGSAFSIQNLAVSTASGAKTTVAFWMYWDGTGGAMPVGWHIYDVYLNLGGIGFNTGAGDMYGVVVPDLVNKWHHVVAVFNNGSVTQNELYLNGVKQVLGVMARSAGSGTVSTTMQAGGWGVTTGQRFGGRMDELRIYNGALTQAEVNGLYNETRADCASPPEGPPPPPPPPPIVSDANFVAGYHFEEPVLNGSANELIDFSGNARHGRAVGSPVPILASANPARSGAAGTCGYTSLTGSTSLRVDNLPVSSTTSVSFWMYWDGTNGLVPVGWNRYGLRFLSGHFGFTTNYYNDIYGISSSGLANGWHHVSAVFVNGDVTKSKLYINGALQSLTQRSGSYGPYNGYAVSGSTLYLGTWGQGGTTFRSSLDEFRIYQGEFTDADAVTLYNETHDCLIKPSFAWGLDETVWSSDAAEVADSGAYQQHGRARFGVSAGKVGQVCRAGEFDRNYIEIDDRAELRFSSNFTVSAWIKTTQEGTILHKGSGSSGYIFSINSSGKLSFWNAGGWVSSTGSSVNDGNWHHVALTVSGTKLQFYRDGVENGASINLANATLSGTAKLGIGGVGGLSGTTPFKGLIDEVLLFNSALSAEGLALGYQNQKSGKSWDGSALACSSLVGAYHLENELWSGVGYEVLDYSGSGVKGTVLTPSLFTADSATPALSGTAGTCGYADANNGVARVDGLDVSATSGDKTTVSFWMYWDGTNNVIPIGWYRYALLISGTHFGFTTTYYNDIYGTSSIGLAYGWHHVVAVFANNNVQQSQLFIDGVEQTLTQRSGSYGPYNDYANVGYSAKNLYIGGHGVTGTRFKGYLDEVRVFKGAVSAEQAGKLYQERHNCFVEPVAEWRLDESSWDGRPDEVRDNAVNALHGQSLFGADTVEGKVCQAGKFANNYVAVADHAKLRLTGRYSVSAWIKTSQAGTIISKALPATGGQGFAFAVDPAGSGKLALWNGSAWVVSDGQVVVDNAWHHVVAVVEDGELRFFVDGAADGSRQAVSATLTGDAPLHIGGGPSDYAPFVGLIDEVLLFDSPLSAPEIAQGYANQNGGKYWDGSEGLCGKLLADYRLEEVSWSGNSGEVKDESLPAYHGVAAGWPLAKVKLDTPARPGLTGTCGYGSFPGGSSELELSLDSVDIATGGRTTVSFWMHWDGTNGAVPFGWGRYALRFLNGKFGFTTNYYSDIYGIESTGLANGWHHVVAVFYNGDITRNQLYIDGVAKSLAQVSGSYGANNGYAYSTKTAAIGGWRSWTSDGFKGLLDEVKVFSGTVNTSQVQQLYRETHVCREMPVSEWHLDEVNWDGSSYHDALDSANNLHAKSFLFAKTEDAKVCRGGSFSENYLEVPDDARLRFTDNFSLVAWIKTTAGAGTIIAKADNSLNGYIFSVGPDSGGRLALWNGTGRWYQSNGVAVNDGAWHHVGVTVQGTRAQFYVDGVPNGDWIELDGLTLAAEGVLRIGKEVTASSASYANSFNGQIDEVLVFNSTLSSNVLNRSYNHQLAGKYWDGTETRCGQMIAQYHIDDLAWNRSTDKLMDSLGSLDGNVIGVPVAKAGRSNPALTGNFGTCGYADLQGSTNNGSAFSVPNLPVSLVAGDKTTVSFWMYWDGTNGVVPIGFGRYALRFLNGHFGFTTNYYSDIYGISSTGLANGWHHIAAVFTNANVSRSKLYLNGVEQDLTQRSGSYGPNNGYAYVNTTMVVGGWGSWSSDRFKSALDEVHVFKGDVSASVARDLYISRHPCNRTAVAEWHFDQTSWGGLADEVMESRDDHIHGVALLGADTETGQVCRAADLKQNYLQMPDHSTLQALGQNFTVTSWVKTAKSSGTIVSKRDATTSAGFTVAIGPDSGGKLAFWNGTKWYVSSGKVLNDNQWHQVAVSVAGRVLTFYVDGVPDGVRVEMTEEATQSSVPLRIGMEDGGVATSRAFEGLIDEVLIFDYGLGVAPMAEGYANQLAGKQWDGASAVCSRVIASYPLEEPDWNKQNADALNELADQYHARVKGTPVPVSANADAARAGALGTCSYAEFGGRTKFTATVTPITTTAGNKTTISFWMYWDGTNGVVPVASGRYALRFLNGHFGFTTNYYSDIYGISSSGLEKSWHHVVAVFTNASVTSNQLYIDGVEQNVSQRSGSYGPNNGYAYFSSSVVLGGWGSWDSDSFKGRLDEFKVIEDAPTAEMVQNLYRETHPCEDLPIAEWHMDEKSWDGRANQVTDSAKSSFHGTPLLGVDTTNGQICRSGDFKQNYVEIADQEVLRLSNEFTVSAWVKTTKGSGTIVAKTDKTSPWAGFVFAIGPDGGGKLAYWNGANWTVSQGQAVNDGNWHHVAVTVKGTALQFYVDGERDGLGLALSSVTTTSTAPLRIGLEHNASPSAVARYFDGQIDELLLFSRALTHVPMMKGYTHQKEGRYWRGTSSLCNVLVAGYHMEETAWQASADKLKDYSGNGNHASVSGVPIPEMKTDNPAIAGTTSGTCGYPEMKGAAFAASGLALPTTAGSKATVSFWMYWDGKNGTVPVAWGRYGLRFLNNHFGFTTNYYNDIFGIDATGLANGWHHVVATFTNGDVAGNQLYIDGKRQAITQRSGSYGPNNGYAYMSANPVIGGWGSWSSDRFTGALDEFHFINGSVNEDHARTLYQSRHACGVTPIAEWHLDDLSWSGNAAEVWDSRDLLLHGSAKQGAALTQGKLCRAGDFSAQSHLEMPNHTQAQLTTNYTITAWVKTSQPFGTIVSKTTSASPWSGYVFAIGPDSGGKLALWNGGAWYVSNGAVVNDNTWHFVAVAVDGYQAQFYVDGKKDGAPITLASLTNTATSPIRLGQQNASGAQARNFVGSLDEVLLFDQTLSNSMITDGYQNYVSGRNWDGAPNLCTQELASYRMEDASWAGVSGEVKDSAGRNVNGQTVGAPLPLLSKSAPARVGANGTCGYGDLSGGAINLSNIPVVTTAGAKTTVSFWMYWDGTNGMVPFAWGRYGLRFLSGHFGFTTNYYNDIFGISSAGLAGGWHHVMAVFTNGNVADNRLYIDGALQTVTQRSGSYGPNNGYAYMSANPVIGGWGSWTSDRFKSRIDEVKIFKDALYPNESRNLYQETHTCPPSIHHVRLEHTGEGLTCTPSEITVYACESQDSGNTCTPNEDGVSGNVVALDSEGAQVAFVPFSIPVGESKTTVSLAVTTQQTTLLDVENVGATATCWDGSAASCSHEFKDSGLILDVPNAFVAETDQTLLVKAVRKADHAQVCVPAFKNVTKSVNMKCSYGNPDSGTHAVRVGGNALNAANAATGVCDDIGRNVSLSFDVNGQAVTNLKYADVGHMRLVASYIGSGEETGLLMTGEDLFISAPKDFEITVDTPSPIKAGSTFVAKVKARNAAGAVTPNFGKEVTPESVSVSSVRAEPTGGGASDGVFSGSLGGFELGIATGNFSWSEVGKLDLKAELDSASYLGSGLTASGLTGTTGLAGRFIPDHFDLQSSYACGSFSYSGQPMTMTVTAKNAQNQTTVNYDGTVATSPNSAQNVVFTGGIGGSWSTVNPAIFEAGVASPKVKFTFSNKYTVPSEVGVSVEDADGVKSTAAAQAKIISGRMRLFNANGHEELDLPVKLWLEYWDGVKWSLNTEDTCTSLTPSQFGFDFPENVKNHISACDTALTVVGTGAETSLNLSAPGVGKSGWGKLTANLDGSLSGQARCTAVGSAGPAAASANLPWLIENNTLPSAFFTFGLTRNSNVIYRREEY